MTGRFSILDQLRLLLLEPRPRPGLSTLTGDRLEASSATGVHDRAWRISKRSQIPHPSGQWRDSSLLQFGTSRASKCSRTLKVCSYPKWWLVALNCRISSWCSRTRTAKPSLIGPLAVDMAYGLYCYQSAKFVSRRGSDSAALARFAIRAIPLPSWLGRGKMHPNGLCPDSPRNFLRVP